MSFVFLAFLKVDLMMVSNKKSGFILMEKQKMSEPHFMAIRPLAVQTFYFNHNVNVTASLRGSTGSVGFIF